MRGLIVVVGSVNLDLVCTGRRIPAPGETVTGETFETFHGGKGANQAVAVGRLEFPVRMIAKVGMMSLDLGCDKVCVRQP